MLIVYIILVNILYYLIIVMGFGKKVVFVVMFSVKFIRFGSLSVFFLFFLFSVCWFIVFWFVCL